jgi:hypothetical protein
MKQGKQEGDGYCPVHLRYGAQKHIRLMLFSTPGILESSSYCNQVSPCRREKGFYSPLDKTLKCNNVEIIIYWLWTQAERFYSAILTHLLHPNDSAEPSTLYVSAHYVIGFIETVGAQNLSQSHPNRIAQLGLDYYVWPKDFDEPEDVLNCFLNGLD